MMKEQTIAEIILHFLRAVFLTGVSLVGAVMLVGFLRGWRTVEAYGSALVWTGAIVMLIAVLTGAGGLSARAGDIGAYTRSGAVNMSENILQMGESRRSALGCLLLLLVVGLGLMAIGYLLPVIVSFLNQR